MSVISENAFYVSQAVVFPTLLKEDVVSHPVRAWKKGSDLEFSYPSFFCAIECTAIHMYIYSTSAIQISPIDKA